MPRAQPSCVASASSTEEMPGLRLRLAQAQRLFGIREDVCMRVLNTLVRQELLRVDASGAFVRNGGRP